MAIIHLVDGAPTVFPDARYKGRGAAFYVPAEKDVLDLLEADDLTILEGRKLRFDCVRLHGDNQSVTVPSASITGAAVGESAQGRTTAHKAGGSGGMEDVWGRTPSGPRELAEAGDVVYAEANGPHRAPRRCGTICAIPVRISGHLVAFGVSSQEA